MNLLKRVCVHKYCHVWPIVGLVCFTHVLCSSADRVLGILNFCGMQSYKAFYRLHTEKYDIYSIKISLKLDFLPCGKLINRLRSLNVTTSLLAFSTG